MNSIKLDAIPSTNDYLKELSRKESLKNFTIVTALNQTNGKGQMGSQWKSETGKNLTMSILIKETLFNKNQIFYLNAAVALSILEVLQEYNVLKLAIKWPNDIMSDTKKIGGILIENSFKTDNTIESVVGIGLNVNQLDFENLSKASSMAIIMNKEFSVDEIILKLHNQLVLNCKNLNGETSNIIWQKYHLNLFKKGIPMPFQAEDGSKFMGIIQGVSLDGKLELLLEDDTIKRYSIREIVMLY